MWALGWSSDITQGEGVHRAQDGRVPVARGDDMLPSVPWRNRRAARNSALSERGTMTSLTRRILAATVLAVAAAVAACGSGPSADEAAITELMMRTWDRPETRLVVGPIAVDGDAALADWTQQSMGGRALLRRRDSQWAVVLCAGDGIKDSSALQLAGLSVSQPQRIIADLIEKEVVAAPE
jgi:hypothetical protein